MVCAAIARRYAAADAARSTDASAQPLPAD
jgi:hypothetical protein